MRLANRALMTTALMVGATGSVHASSTYREWINHCTTGTFKACASIQVNLVNRPGPTGTYDLTDVEIRVVNLQGRNSWLPDSGPYTLGRLLLSGLTVTGLPDDPYTLPPGLWLGGGIGAPTPEGGAGPAYSNLPAYGFEYWANPVDSYPNLPAGWFMSLYSDVPGYAPVWGCDLPQDNPFGGWQTCEGSLRLNFTIGGTWSFTDASKADLGGLGILGSDTAQVTPEPVTMVLLATGLAGVGGAALRRRRKDA